jgi:NAD(P)-dependent dehydrogenase (short-subunit alcohol dehydrogenase family)
VPLSAASDCSYGAVAIEENGDGVTGELRFDGEVAVVTGAGNGLGRGHALELAARGAAVVCNDIDGAAANRTADEIATSGGRAVAETSSVATPEGGAAIVQAAIDSFGSVEILVNNAGQLRPAPFEDMPAASFEAVVTTHLFGAFYVTQPAFRFMKDAGYGRILFTSSSSGVFGSPWAANYAAAKTGMLGLNNVVSLEGAAHGIRSNVIMPQALDTAMSSDGSPPYPDEYLQEMLTAFRPFGRHITVDNVTPLVVYLVHRSCDFTQQIYSVGGGHVGRVFIGAAPGWSGANRTLPRTEELAAHLDEASDLTGFEIMGSATDELLFMAQHMTR